MGTLADPRRRNLVILGVLTALFVALAMIALMQRAHERAPKFEPHLLFPDLKNHLSELGAIRIKSKSGNVTIKYDKAKGWEVAEGGYPASEEQVRQTAIAMAELEAVEPKTSQPEWLGYIGLDGVGAKGSATGITLLDRAGHTLAALLMGKSDEIADITGRTGVYVRKPGDNQTWLARGYLVPKASVGDWLEKRVLNVARDRIKETSVTPLQGEPYTVMRDKKEDPDFKIADMPEGRELSFPGAADSIGAAIVGFTFDEVQPAAQFDFNNAARINTTTFDGLTVAVKVIQESGAYWATILAAGTTPAAQTEAAAINARTSGWAYKLPGFSGQTFMTALETLLKPVGGDKPEQPAPEEQPSP